MKIAIISDLHGNYEAFRSLRRGLRRTLGIG